MYILISLFVVYAAGIISYELNIFNYYLAVIFTALLYSSIINKKILYNGVVLSFVLLSFINCNYNRKSLLSQYINENISVEAKIKRQNKSDDNSYYASVISISNNSVTEENTILYAAKNEKLKENSIVKINCNVADNQLSRNRMLFNYKNYLRSKKISTALFSSGQAVTINENYSYFNNISLKFRNYIENTFYSNLNKKNANIILSIILGNVNYLDEEIYDNIKIMGLAHIFAVSGTHIVLMYAFLLNIFKFVASRKISWILSWCLIWFYGFLIGFPLSIMRALVMFTMLFGSEVFYRKYNSLNSIGLAALILTLYNPFWLFDAGFLLSFSAALSFIIYNNYVRIEGYFKTIYMYLFLQIFTLPVIIYYFNFIPVMGVIYNLLLLPIFTVILLYGFILLILNPICWFLLVIPFRIFNYILYSLVFIIDVSENIPFNGIIMPTMSIINIIFFYTALFFMLYLYNEKIMCKKYCFAAIISFYAITYIVFPIVDDNLYFNVADAGQGLFTTISYKNIDMVIDCGSSSNKNMGEFTVIPYLTKRGILKIDALFISHWDDDHYSGLKDLLSSNIKVNNIYASENNEDFPDSHILIKGQHVKIDNKLEIEILWPYDNLIFNNINNSSMVILINFNNKKILLPGDIEEAAEYAIYNDLTPCNILVAPHHGSKTSSTVQFVDAVKPEFAVLSYGRNNYGIPSKEVVERYENVKSKIFSTFKYGEINFILKGTNVYYNTYINEKSKNYYELYFEFIIPKILIFCFLIIWILRGEENELEHY